MFRINPEEGERSESEPEAAMGDETVGQPELAAMRTELRRLLERRIDALPEQCLSCYRPLDDLRVTQAPASVRLSLERICGIQVPARNQRGLRPLTLLVAKLASPSNTGPGGREERGACIAI